MQVHRDAHAGLLLPWGWVALCLMSLLHLNNLTYVATETTAPGISPSVPTNESSEKTTIPNILGSTNSYLFPQGSNETTSAISETMINFTATTGNTSGSGTTQAFVQSQTSPAVTLPTTSDNASTSEMTWEPSVPSVNVSDYSPNNISFEMTSTTEPYAYTSSSIAPITIKGEIKCSGIREVRLAQGICLELSEAASCDEFKKEKGEGLTQILCGKEGAEADAGASVCSLLLAQSEVRPECLLMVLANSTELSSKLQLMEKHQSDLRKLGIQSFNKQDIGSHQSYSRKTLIALVTSGVLLAILGTTGYFLMNRRSWSPTGERLVSSYARCHERETWEGKVRRTRTSEEKDSSGAALRLGRAYWRRECGWLAGQILCGFSHGWAEATAFPAGAAPDLAAGWRGAGAERGKSGRS